MFWDAPRRPLIHVYTPLARHISDRSLIHGVGYRSCASARFVQRSLGVASPVFGAVAFVALPGVFRLRLDGFFHIFLEGSLTDPRTRSYIAKNSAEDKFIVLNPTAAMILRHPNRHCEKELEDIKCG